MSPELDSILSAPTASRLRTIRDVADEAATLHRISPEDSCAYARGFLTALLSELAREYIALRDGGGLGTYDHRGEPVDENGGAL